MTRLIAPLLLLFALCTAPAAAQDVAIFPRGEKAPNVHHKGDVWLYHPSDADETFDYNLAVATFAPDARLDWHSHPAGQQLIITDGVGYYQERGQARQTVRKGDVVKCRPGVEHWHASTPEQAVTYLAITGDEPTQWLEPVADEVYYAEDEGPSAVEQELLDLSRQKWQWMADKDADRLAELFHDQAVFVHMGGSWGKDREVDIIRGGGIHYQNAEVHDVVVETFGSTTVLWNRITLTAEVRGNVVSNEFTVTEIYEQRAGEWKLLGLTFSSVRDTHELEH